MAARAMAVTGAFGALGRVLAREATRRGWAVAALDVAPAAPDELVRDLAASGAAFAGVDLSTPAGAAAALGAAQAKFGRLDALVNVAGGFVWSKTEDADPAEWARMAALNLGTTLNASRAALPFLLESGAGRIVNVGALGALKAGAGFGPYAASKSAVHRLTEALAEETKGRGVTVNAVLPSTIDTPANRRDMPTADFAKWVRAEELAAAILFLASQEASGITGALLPVVGRV
ncbi:MAG: SDR family NAD(P)-dependent oxidoreductase [Hyphomicrobiales bacterium]|nr:SDR family NAD(P)-dependent oxidoreductase [Hyphomicrobiales bacterium]